MRKASLTATKATPAIRLLHNLATSPAPISPTWMILAPIASSADPARHRRVDKADALLGEAGGDALRGAGIDRGHVDAEAAARDAFEDAAGAEIGGFDIARGRQDRDHHVAGGGRLGRRAGARRDECH